MTARKSMLQRMFGNLFVALALAVFLVGPVYAQQDAPGSVSHQPGGPVVVRGADGVANQVDVNFNAGGFTLTFNGASYAFKAGDVTRIEISGVQTVHNNVPDGPLTSPLACTPQTIDGTAGDDFLEGGCGDDTIQGFDGDDVLLGKGGNDALYGGTSSLGSINDGNDVLRGGQGDDALDGGTNDTPVLGGANGDAANFASATSGVTADLNTGTATGGDGSDTLVAIESLIGGSFDDTLTGDGGNNNLDGHQGSDTLTGNAGEDDLKGASGNDVLDAGADADNLFGGIGNDTLLGGTSDDFLQGSDGDDTLDCDGDPSDRIGYTDAPGGVVVSLGTLGPQNTVNAGFDTLTACEGVVGSLFADTLSGSTAANYIDGNDGDDTLHGQSGDDSMFGGAGNDTIRGQAGNDTLDGGADTDTLSYAGSTLAVSANLTTGTGTDGFGNIDTYTNFENIIGSNNADTLRGDGGPNVISGGIGNDTIIGMAGADTLNGNGNTDILWQNDDAACANDGAVDTLDGGPGSDTAHFSAADGDVVISATSVACP